MRRPTFQVFTEGRKTEPQYLTAWKRLYRDRVLLEIEEGEGPTPYRLVEAAVAAKRRAQRDQRRGKGQAPDAYWCVFDTDEHTRLEDAIALAREFGIEVAVSVPCFELWLLLHHADHRGWIGQQDVQRKLRDLTSIEKTLNQTQLAELVRQYDVARERAIALDAMHDRNDSQDQNPSTGVWRLVDAIRAAAER